MCWCEVCVSGRVSCEVYGCDNVGCVGVYCVLMDGTEKEMETRALGGSVRCG